MFNLALPNRARTFPPRSSTYPSYTLPSRELTAETPLASHAFARRSLTIHFDRSINGPSTSQSRASSCQRISEQNRCPTKLTLTLTPIRTHHTISDPLTSATIMTTAPLRSLLRLKLSSSTDTAYLSRSFLRIDIDTATFRPRVSGSHHNLPASRHSIPLTTETPSPSHFHPQFTNSHRIASPSVSASYCTRHPRKMTLLSTSLTPGRCRRKSKSKP